MLAMAKQLLQLQADAAAASTTHRRSAARRRQLLSPLPARHAPAAGAGRFASCFLACLLALAAGAALTLCVTLHRPEPDAASPRSHGGDSGSGGYAVVINTWKRYGLLKRAVAHYSGCAGVGAVHVVWSEPREPPEALRRSVLNCSRAAGAEVRFAMNRGAGDSLNNRFRPVQGLRTDAVFSVDDDLLVPCSTLRFAFGVWRSAPSAMVGFVPRMHWPAVQAQRSNAEEYKYGSWWSVWRTGTYSMVLSKASFFHRRYLDLYTNHMLPSIRDYVTENRNCEDIAMSFLVANVTGAPPIWVQGRIFEIGSTGISSLKGHDLRRSKCLNAFASMYGHMPLVATTVKAVDSRTSWFW